MNMDPCPILLPHSLLLLSPISQILYLTKKEVHQWSISHFLMRSFVRTYQWWSSIRCVYLLWRSYRIWGIYPFINRLFSTNWDVMSRMVCLYLVLPCSLCPNLIFICFIGVILAMGVWISLCWPLGFLMVSLRWFS